MVRVCGPLRSARIERGVGLGGLAFTLRSAPDGYIATSVTNAIQTKIGPSCVLAERNQVLIRPRTHGPNMVRLRPA
jgi:hypothetical protein